MKNWFPVFLGIFCFALPVCADNTELLSAPPRWILVVDASYSMNRLKPVIADMVHDLLDSGVNHRMQSEDIFEIWTLHQQKEVFPYRIWLREHKSDLAASAKQWLLRERFQQKKRKELWLEEIQEILQSSETVSILLFTDGGESIQGTPFDQQINAIYREHSRNLRRAKVPFVVVLNAHRGQFVSWVVHSGGGAIHVPALPATLVQTTPAPRALADEPGPVTAQTAPSLPSEDSTENETAIETTAPSTPDSPLVASAASEPDLPFPASEPGAEPDSPSPVGPDVPNSSAAPIPSDALEEIQPPTNDLEPTQITEPAKEAVPNEPAETLVQVTILPSPELPQTQEPTPAPPAQPPSTTQAPVPQPPPSGGPIPSESTQERTGNAPAEAGGNRTRAILVVAMITLAGGILVFGLFSPKPRQPSLISKSFERKNPVRQRDFHK